MITIYESRGEGSITLQLEGSLDAVTAPSVQSHFNNIKLHIGDTLIIDMSKLEYIASAGLRVLIVMLNYLTPLGKKLRITNIPYEIRDVLDATGLMGIFARDEHFVIVEKVRKAGEAVYNLGGELDDSALKQIGGLLVQMDVEGVKSITLDCAEVSMMSPEMKTLLKNEIARFAKNENVLAVTNIRKSIYWDE
jgi:anti-anti-sigma factor